MSDTAKFHIQRFGTLRADRGNFNAQWEEAASVILPSHRDSFQGMSSQAVAASQGQKKAQQQYDSTAMFACMRFASVMESLSIPQGTMWSRLVPVDKMLKRNRRVRIFFDDLSELLHNQRYRPVGNFVGNSQEALVGLGAYGNGVLFVDQPENERGLRYRNIPLGEAYFVQNHAHVVDTMYRCFWLTMRQGVQQFGARAPQVWHDKVKDGKGDSERVEILHCVYPQTDRDPERVDYKGMAFASLYIAVSDQKVLEEGGYRSWPFPVARYAQAPGETYGRGPGQFVLPAIKVLNEQKKDVLEQAHRAVRPVLLAHDDGQLGNFQMKAGKLNAGGISKDGKRLIDVLPVGNIAIGEDMMEIERNAINDAFLITLFQILVDNPQMTATEVLERAREKGMLLAPTAGRLQAEFLGPLISRELELMYTQGIWPADMPAILEGAPIEYKIEYDSPISRMAQSEKLTGWDRAIMRAAEYFKLTQDPEILDHFDFDVAMPTAMEIDGVPTTWIRSEDAVAQRRAGRADAAQAQQMVEAAPAVASLAKNVAPAQG